MIMELHIIQNFAPSNLNRDDTGSPKDCEFGGYRRARISSQCIKRAVRKHGSFADAVSSGGGDVGVRTKRVKTRLEEIFEASGKQAEEAGKVAASIIDLLGLKLGDEEKTEYLLYLGENEIKEIAKTAEEAWDTLLKVEVGKEKKKKGAVQEDMKKIQASLSSVISKSRKESRSYAADIALFGRMVADSKNMNVDASCQVAHAISTHKVEMEMDYFTAVDDLLPDDDSGSDMIGVVEFNSSCFYRYSLIDINKLSENLGLNSDLLKAVVKGYISASIKAVPTGKLNSTGHHNAPCYARVILREDGFPWSLANAFQKPVFADRGSSLEERSIEALTGYYDRLKKVYGGSIACDAAFNIHDPSTQSLDDLIVKVMESLPGGGSQ